MVVSPHFADGDTEPQRRERNLCKVIQNPQVIDKLMQIGLPAPSGDSVCTPHLWESIGSG